MVQDRITDGDRIAELLIAELRGWTNGPLAPVTVQTGETVHHICLLADAGQWDPRREPSASAVKDTIGKIAVNSDHVRLTIDDEQFQSVATTTDLPFRDGGLIIDSGAAVKQAVDAVEQLFG